MKKDIIQQKIRRELNNLPIDTEPRVMYLMVEIRKVLEHENQKNTLLNFYGDWIVHTKLDRKFANQVFSEIINEKSLMAYHIKSFGLLKNELQIFIDKHNLPKGLLSEHWIAFRDNLLNILVDTPIINKEGDKSFGFSKGDGVGGIQYYIKDKEHFQVLGRVWI